MSDPTGPDYRLAVTSNNLAPDSIQLNEAPESLLTTLSTGANAQYPVNGQPTDVSSKSNQMTLSPGLTVQLNQDNIAGHDHRFTLQLGLPDGTVQFRDAYTMAVAALAEKRAERRRADRRNDRLPVTDMLKASHLYVGLRLGRFSGGPRPHVEPNRQMISTPPV